MSKVIDNSTLKEGAPMSVSIILQQMGVICILVAIGIYLYKKQVIDDLTSQKLSAIVVDVCNPAFRRSEDDEGLMEKSCRRLI